MATPPAVSIPQEKIETVAQALYEHRHKATNGSWASFKTRKPDVAKIYRENAEVAIKALDRI